MGDQPADDYVVDTGKGTFKLSELGILMPGMAEVMPRVGDRIWRCYYAGLAKNQPLAAFQLKEAVSLMRKAAVLRPKYTENIERFIGVKVRGVSNAIAAEDWAAFEEAFRLMVESANAYHDFYDKGFLRWKVPETPPPDLDMTPRA